VDLLGKHIEGQFYAEELSPVIVTKKTVYRIDKILRKRVRNGINAARGFAHILVTSQCVIVSGIVNICWAWQC
jgi:hypothetical protein